MKLEFSPRSALNLGTQVCQSRQYALLGLAGKPQGVDGSQVEAMVNAGQIDEVAQYCESDVLNTYRVWLIYEHFRGTITTDQLEWSEMQIREFVRAHKLSNPHLNAAMGITSPTVLAPINAPISPNATDSQGM